MHKTSGYVRTVVTLHNIRDWTREAVESLQERSIGERVHDRWNQTRQAVSSRTRRFFAHPENAQCEHIPQKYGYVFRPKSRWELVLLSGTVCGIEFCYAAETAFVTPILLSLGLSITYVTMIWCLSPLIGFFLTPILGSLSDTCESRFGRRRPFILLLSIGILLGLILVPNGHHIGIALGDTPNIQIPPEGSQLPNASLFSDSMPGNVTFEEKKKWLSGNTQINFTSSDLIFSNANTRAANLLVMNEIQAPNLHSISKKSVEEDVQSAIQIPVRNTTGHIQPWSIVFTVIGTVLLDFCSDACQSPSRTYLLDVSLHEDHNVGLSTFTLMAGFGGSIGYLMGAVNWESTFLGDLMGGQVSAVFMIVTIVFIFCLFATLCSFPEIPLSVLKDPKMFQEYQQKLQIGEFQEKGNELDVIDSKVSTYGSTSANGEVAQTRDLAVKEIANGNFVATELKTDAVAEVKDLPVTPMTPESKIDIDDQPTLREYLRSIIHMPKSLRILCLTNLFCWMSLVCYSLYFTDFVGEVVYGGDPQAPEGSPLSDLYKDGVSFGCYGMALYSISCSVYSFFIESLVKRLGAKTVYIGGQLVYSVGMVLMAIARHPVAVILLSPSAGIMYSTLFTMPYLLIAHYHCMQKFRDDKSGGECGIRGIGTDVASVSSMVFLSQFIISLSMGSIVKAVNSNVATVCAAAFLSACGAISATQVMYLDM